MLPICANCGERLQVPVGYARSKMRCPACGVICELPPRPEAASEQRIFAADGILPADEDETFALQPVPPSPPPVRSSLAQSVQPARRSEAGRSESARPRPDDPAETYEFRAGGRACPRCQASLAADATSCLGCGYDFPPPAPTEFEPVQRQWEAGLPLRPRLALFLVGQGVSLFLAVVATFTGWLSPFLVTWIFFTLLTAFLLGTYDRCDLKRSAQGKLTLTKTWRLLFVEQAPQRIPLGGHPSVHTGYAERFNDFWNWIIFVVLLCYGIVPGLLWWYFAIHQDHFYVALTDLHGNPDVYLYQGWKLDQVKDMAETLGEVTGMPYNRIW